MARSGIAGRLERLLEEQFDVSLRPASEIARIESHVEEAEAIRAEAEDLGYYVNQYFSGRPQELRHWTRQGLFQRSRHAWGWDPVFGREVQLYGDFSLGRGVGIPQARSPKVQKVIDRAWKDPQNEEELTSPEAQRTLSNELRTSANAFLATYVKGPRIRVGWLDTDSIRDIVPDPEYRRRPIYYVGVRRTFAWNAEQDRPAFEDSLTEEMRPKVTYFKHWRNLEKAEREREANEGLAPLPSIPTEKQDPTNARVFHIRVNRLGEQQWGMPFAARHLRFLSAMNEFVEARVEVARGVAQFIAKRSVKGGPEDVVRQATSLLSHVGEIGAGRPTEDVPARDPFMRGSTPAGDWLTESDAVKTESLSLNSGAGNAALDAQVIRSPIAAAAGLGQHLLGDASNANLATASTLELPTTMGMLSWQDVLEAVYKHFTDEAISAAVRAGELGGQNEETDPNSIGEDDPRRESIEALIEAWGEERVMRPLDGLAIEDPVDREIASARTGEDLSYEFQMPFPGRRQLDDVSNLASTTMEILDPQGANLPLRRLVLRFLLVHGYDHPDPDHVVKEALPDGSPPTGQLAPARGAAGRLPSGQPDPSLRSTYGERRRTLGPEGSLAKEDLDWIPPELRAAAASNEEVAAALFRELVGDPGVMAGLTLAGNGDGGSG